MLEIEVNLPLQDDLAQWESVFEASCRGRVTRWPKYRRMWFKIRVHRQGVWMTTVIDQLKSQLENSGSNRER